MRFPSRNDVCAVSGRASMQQINTGHEERSIHEETRVPAVPETKIV
jgi:hypothetical protein